MNSGYKRCSGRTLRWTGVCSARGVSREGTYEGRLRPAVGVRLLDLLLGRLRVDAPCGAQRLVEVAGRGVGEVRGRARLPPLALLAEAALPRRGGSQPRLSARRRALGPCLFRLKLRILLHIQLL